MGERLTGYPLVDASVRCLRQTGYLNFRMRSMIVSFFTHHLWQPWQEASHFLARNFLTLNQGFIILSYKCRLGNKVNTIEYIILQNAIERDNTDYL